MQSPIWTQLAPAVLKVAVYFQLKSSYTPSRWYDGTNMVLIPRGSFVTSYASTASDCRLSLQQTRDAFAHLERTQFATYRRTPRWTLVRVLGCGIYECPTDDENTRQTTYATGQRTPDKEKKKKTINTCASPGVDAPNGDHEVHSAPSASERGPFGNRRRTIPELSPEQEAKFEEWWAISWRRVAKKEARAAFAKHVTSEALFQEIMAATRSQAPEMLAREERYRPLPATWLNGERWRDEVTEQRREAKKDDYPEV